MPETDGNISWTGGMDSSRYPSDLADNQYFRGCNVQLRRSNGGISSRDGIHHVDIDFNNHKFLEELYRTGHIQASESFNDGYRDFLVCAVNGYIILFEEVTDCCWKAKLLHCNQNNPSRAKGWFTKVPFGVIYNDGQSLPLWITSTEWRRSDPSKDEIGVGQMGTYVQNRFFYVDEFSREIYFSDFRDPLNRGESISANLLSFAAPEDEDIITAISRRKAMINYVEGGVLIFSTLNNIYSVDVRGPVDSWELQSNTLGKVQESVRGIGASSAYSFEPFNTNIYFRSREFGICDLRQSQAQFNQDDDFTSQSIEAAYWLENDTEWMLDQCYTKGYNGRLYTTIAPEFREDGYVFWNGLLVYHPDPRYSNSQSAPRRFEGIVTGVRPWSLTVIKSNNRRQRLFIHSYDKDGVNRLYQMTDSNHDKNHNGDRVEIESWVETRGYNFGNEFLPKTTNRSFYKLRDLPRDLLIKVFSKKESEGSWIEYHNAKHLVGGLQRSEVGGIIPSSIKNQGRNQVNLSSERNGVSSFYGSLSGNEFYSRQDRIEIKGSFVLDKLIKEGELKEMKQSMEKETERFQLVYDYRPDFSYSIATANLTNW